MAQQTIATTDSVESLRDKTNDNFDELYEVSPSTGDALRAVPASAGATGTVGMIRFDATHVYFCVATDTWVRTTIATWS